MCYTVITMAFFKNLLIKQMVKRQLKGVPEAQQEMILEAVEKNPELFTKIAEKVQERTKGGMGQMEASMKTLREFESELKSVFGAQK